MRYYKIPVIALFSILISACGEKADNSARDVSVPSAQDTSIGSRIVTDELAGSAYRERAKAYFIINGRDTSDFICYVEESKDDHRINMEIRFRNDMAYRRQLNELHKIIPEAAKDFNMDSLSSVYIGRLVNTGDMAIHLTNEYIRKYGKRKHPENNKEFILFLLNTKLAADFNGLFKPYAVEVKFFCCEKLFFTTRDKLYIFAETESDSSLAPEKILDCMTWINFK